MIIRILVMSLVEFLKITDSLYQTKPKPFYGYVTVGYLIVREEGNLLIDAPEDIIEYKEAIKSLGALKYHYFTHHHKSLSSKTERELQALFKIKSERPGLWKWNYFEDKLDCKNIDSNLSIVYVPGHTSDSVVISWKEKNDQISWFTGDTVYVERGKLVRTVSFSENNTELNRTLRKMMNWKVDWVYGSIGSQTMLNLKIKDLEDWKENLKSCIAQY